MTEKKLYKDRMRGVTIPKGPLFNINFTVGKKGAESIGDGDTMPARVYINVAGQKALFDTIEKQLGVPEGTILHTTLDDGNTRTTLKVVGFGFTKKSMMQYMIADSPTPIHFGGLIEFTKNTFTGKDGTEKVEVSGIFRDLFDPTRFSTKDLAVADVATTVAPITPIAPTAPVAQNETTAPAAPKTETPFGATEDNAYNDLPF